MADARKQPDDAVAVRARQCQHCRMMGEIA